MACMELCGGVAHCRDSHWVLNTDLTLGLCLVSAFKSVFSVTGLIPK